MSVVIPRTRYALLLAVLLRIPAAAAAEPPQAVDQQPPVAPVMERTFTLHGATLSDPYAGLKDRNHPAVGRYIEQENLYAQERLAPLRPLADELYREMLGRIKETDETPPVKDGRWWYYSRTEAGKPYPIHARKQETLDADEEILLDLNCALRRVQLPRAGRVRAVRRWAVARLRARSDRFLRIHAPRPGPRASS